MRLRCLLGALFVSCAAASTITSGEITTLPAAPGQSTLTSSAGYTVEADTDGGLLLTTLGCVRQNGASPSAWTGAGPTLP